MCTAAFAARMGQNQSKNSASGLARLLLVFCQSQLAGIIRAHPINPWLVLLQPRPVRGVLKIPHPCPTKALSFLIPALVAAADASHAHLANFSSLWRG